MKIGIVGCAGRMGRMVVSEVLAGAGCTLAGGTEQPGSAALGSDVAALAGGEPAGIGVGDDAKDPRARLAFVGKIHVAQLRRGDLAGGGWLGL